MTFFLVQLWLICHRPVESHCFMGWKFILLTQWLLRKPVAGFLNALVSAGQEFDSNQLQYVLSRWKGKIHDLPFPSTSELKNKHFYKPQTQMNHSFCTQYRGHWHRFHVTIFKIIQHHISEAVKTIFLL